MKDSLGDRMKDIEGRTKVYLPRRCYTLIRLDGKAFHTYTMGLDRPFDDGLISAMQTTTELLCRNIQGTFVYKKDGSWYIDKESPILSQDTKYFFSKIPLIPQPTY